jgi:hypothetical protein
LDREPAPWQATHIFYAADPRPLLTECVATLVRQLRDRGLIERYFFINYWLEGPHVRLRLKPAGADRADEVRRTAHAAIAGFLARRPALYEVDGEYLAFSADMFRLEYSDEEWAQRYGEGGTMPLRQNNSFSEEPYEPEYLKYGGPDGVALAEWHFEQSSDLVLELIGRTNLHVRTVMLGIAAQLMMIMSATFLADRAEVAQFLTRYHGFWQHAFELGTPEREARYQASYASMADGLSRRVDEIGTAVWAGHHDRLTSFRRLWAEHSGELRARVSRLAEQGRLAFPPRDGTDRPPVTMTDPATALRVLLMPYLHMTNNRLGATIMDEAYLSYLLAQALQGQGEAVGSVPR